MDETRENENCRFLIPRFILLFFFVAGKAVPVWRPYLGKWSSMVKESVSVENHQTPVCIQLAWSSIKFIKYMKNKRPTWCHLLFYFTSYVLNMFRTLLYPSSGACDYSVELSHWSYCSWFDVCWSFGVVGLEWYPCCRLKPAILFHCLCARHVSDINISIIRSLRLFCWITTLVVLFLVRCVLVFRCGWVGVVSVLQAEACKTDTDWNLPHHIV